MLFRLETFVCNSDHKRIYVCVFIIASACVCVCVCIRKLEKVCDNKEVRRHRRSRCRRHVRNGAARKGGCRLFFISPAAFQNSVVTLLECFQRVREEMLFSRTRECAAAYKAQKQIVYATGDNLNVSSPE